MTALLLDLLLLLRAGFTITPLPGTPVDILCGDGAVTVVCAGPAGVWRLDDAGITSPDTELSEPRSLALWSGMIAVSDAGTGTVVSGERVYRFQGGVEGIATVDWYGDGIQRLAVCLFEPGAVTLLHRDGLRTVLAELPGAKDVKAADVDGDGDRDLFAAGCGTGVVVIENAEEGPLVHPVGNIGAGVKRIAAADMDGDGLTDVVGLACAEGGAGWWRNPGDPGLPWEFVHLLPELSGPKALAVSGDTLLIASLYSPLHLTGSHQRFPTGFISCAFDGRDGIVAGHRMGFLIRGPRR